MDDHTRLRRAQRHHERVQWFLEYARVRCGRSMRRSNRAWLISAVAAAGGTLMAVSDLRAANAWSEAVEVLEGELLEATIELRLAQEALRRAS